MESKVVWQDGMAFAAELDGHHFTIDAAAEHGGRDLGPRPKGLVVSALIGCTAMDVISILRKMRQDVTTFAVTGQAELTEDHPKQFSTIRVVYRAEGTIDRERFLRAVELSEDRYCGVSATLRPSVTLTSEVWLNEEKIQG